MTAYAIAHLQDVRLGPEIVDYIARIDETLATYDGRFLIHGATPEVMEGPWEGDLVVIAFPDRQAAHGWYASPAYQAILPLRTRNSRSAAIIVDGVPESLTSQPPLTTIVQPIMELGRRAAASILDGKPETIELPVNLAVRASTGPCSR